MKAAKGYLYYYFFPSKINLFGSIKQLLTLFPNLLKVQLASLNKGTHTFVIPSFKQFSSFNHFTVHKSSKPHAPEGMFADLALSTDANENTQVWPQMQILCNYVPCTNLHNPSFSCPWLGNEIITHTPRGYRDTLKQFFIFSCQKVYTGLRVCCQTPEPYPMTLCWVKRDGTEEKPFIWPSCIFSFEKLLHYIQLNTNQYLKPKYFALLEFKLRLRLWDWEIWLLLLAIMICYPG